ncbi:MAG TPA: glycerate kinase, partial [Clostridiales bacterium]|nr:glycerate kinase [Clostridiales bacterium]
SGLALAPEKKPLTATSYGTGELIAHALAHGFKEITVTVGGSAVNDGGVGMLRALGYRFLDARGAEVGCGAQDLQKIVSVDGGGRMAALSDCKFTVLCDVSNPLLGEYGATYVYGGQKGLSGEQFARVEAGMVHFADVAEQYLGIRCREQAGMGAAGGMGFALKAFLDAEIRPGIETVLAMIGMDERMAAADLVITGEGRTDAQSAFGKAPAGVGEMAKRRNIPVVLISGALGDGFERLYGQGVHVAVPCVDRLSSFKYVTRHAEEQLKRAASRAAKLIAIGRQIRGKCTR